MSRAKRPNFSRRCCANRRTSGSSSQCRAVVLICMSVLVRVFACRGARGATLGSCDPPAKSRGQDVELLAILRHGPAGDAQAPLVEELGDALVGQRLLLVLLVDQGLDDVLGGGGRDVLAVLGLESAGEKKLELEHAARRLHVLAAADPAHGRLV